MVQQMVEKTKGVTYLAKTFTLPDVHAEPATAAVSN